MTQSILSGTEGSISTKNSLKGSFISPSIIHYLIIVKIGAETYFNILLINYFVEGLPFRTYEFIAEQTAPPFKLDTESIIIASHFILSKGS